MTTDNDIFATRLNTFRSIHHTKTYKRTAITGRSNISCVVLRHSSWVRSWWSPEFVSSLFATENPFFHFILFLQDIYNSNYLTLLTRNKPCTGIRKMNSYRVEAPVDLDILGRVPSYQKHLISTDKIQIQDGLKYISTQLRGRALMDMLILLTMSIQFLTDRG